MCDTRCLDCDKTGYQHTTTQPLCLRVSILTITVIVHLQICWLSSISSISVGMYPMVLMHSPRSLQLIKPSLSLSNSLNASRSSAGGSVWSKECIGVSENWKLHSLDLTFKRFYTWLQATPFIFLPFNCA